MSEEVRSVIEWVVSGTPLMVYGVVRSVSGEANLTVWEIRGQNRTTLVEGVQLPTDVFMRVPVRRRTEGTNLAFLTLQLLPGERTLISIETAPEQEATVQPFIEHLIQRLIELRFADEPPPPKRRLGFTLP